MSVNLATQIRDYAQEVDAAQAPVTLDQLLEVRVGKGPVRPIEPRPKPIASPYLRPPGQRRWVAALAAAAVVLLAGLVLVWAQQSAGDAPVVNQPVSSSTIPDGPDATGTTVALTNLEGTVVGRTEIAVTEVAPSSIGDLEWTVINDPSLLAGGIVVTPSGFASVSSDGQLLISDDAVEWRAVVSPFPGRLEEVLMFGAEYFLNATVDGELAQWVSSDFVTWSLGGAVPESAAVSGLAEWIQGPEFLRMSPSWWPEDRQDLGLRTYSETPDGAYLVYAEWAIDWDSLALQVGGDDLQQRMDNGEVLGGRSWDPATGIVDFNIFASRADWNAVQDNWPNGPEGQPSGVQIRLTISGTIDDWIVELEDVARNESLGSITGSLPPLGLEDSAERLSGLTIEDTADWLVGYQSLGAHFLSSENGLELVDHPPWVSLPGDTPTFILTDDMLYAYYDSGDWQSPDGRTWQPIGDTVVPVNEIPGDFIEGPDGILLASSDLTVTDGLAVDPFVRSYDGVEWTLPSQPPVLVGDTFPATHVMATDSGFMFMVYQSEVGGFALWTSTDGDIWEKVDLPTFGPAEPAIDPSTVTSSGNVAIITTKRDGPQAPGTVWIIEILATQ